MTLHNYVLEIGTVLELFLNCSIFMFYRKNVLEQFYRIYSKHCGVLSVLIIIKNISRIKLVPEFFRNVNMVVQEYI